MRSENAVIGRVCRPLFKATGLLAAVVMVQCGCGQSPKSYGNMSETEQLDYLRGQASHALIVEASNAVPGIRDVLEVNANTTSDAVDKWNGKVRVNYLNQTGGVEITNLQMAFIVTFDGRLYACGTSKLDGSVVENKQ